MFLIDDLTLEAAYRMDDYSTAGKVDAFKFGLNWAPTETVRVRAVFTDSVRAPDINDLFAGQAQTYVPIDDPCAGSEYHYLVHTGFPVRAIAMPVESRIPDQKKRPMKAMERFLSGQPEGCPSFGWYQKFIWIPRR